MRKTTLLIAFIFLASLGFGYQNLPTNPVVLVDLTLNASDVGWGVPIVNQTASFTARIHNTGRSSSNMLGNTSVGYRLLHSVNTSYAFEENRTIKNIPPKNFVIETFSFIPELEGYYTLDLFIDQPTENYTYGALSETNEANNNVTKTVYVFNAEHGTFYGYVWHCQAETCTKIDGASISAKDNIFSTTTDETGYYELHVPFGTYAISAFKPFGINQTKKGIVSQENKAMRIDFNITGVPTANAGDDKETYVGDVITLNGAGYDEDGYIVLYEWDFDYNRTFSAGWNSTSSGTVSVVYDVAGTYIVVLKVTDNDSKTAYDNTTVHVYTRTSGSTGRGSTIFFIEGSETSSKLILNGSVKYDFSLFTLNVNRSYEISNTMTKIKISVKNLADYRRNFTIIETIPKTLAADFSEIQNITPSPIIYDVDPVFGWNISLNPGGIFEAVYFFGRVLSREEFLKISMTDVKENIPEKLPQLIANASGNRTVYVNQTFQLNGTANRPVVLYEWDFDYNGTFSADWNSTENGLVNISFIEPGNYTVALRVKDSGGSTATDAATIIVIYPQPTPTGLTGFVVGFFGDVRVGITIIGLLLFVFFLRQKVFLTEYEKIVGLKRKLNGFKHAEEHIKKEQNLEETFEEEPFKRGAEELKIEEELEAEEEELETEEDELEAEENGPEAEEDEPEVKEELKKKQAKTDAFKKVSRILKGCLLPGLSEDELSKPEIEEKPELEDQQKPEIEEQAKTDAFKKVSRILKKR
jgi:hypothetical protein